MGKRTWITEEKNILEKLYKYDNISEIDLQNLLKGES